MTGPIDYSNGKYTFEIFPQEYIDLDREIGTEFHPKLQVILAQHGDYNDLDMKLAQIAAYCEVGLDGVYDLESRIKLCRILKEKLILKREVPQGSIILPFGTA